MNDRPNSLLSNPVGTGMSIAELGRVSRDYAATLPDRIEYCQCVKSIVAGRSRCIHEAALANVSVNGWVVCLIRWLLSQGG